MAEECKKCCKKRCFCEQNSKICAESRMSSVMEQLRAKDLECCKTPYVVAKLPTLCDPAPCTNRT